MKKIPSTLLTIVAIAGFLCILCPASLQAEKTRVLFDSDANNELDDQHALAYLLFSGDAFDLEGVSVNRTKNGGDVSKQREEAVRVVKLCNLHPRVKVYTGANGEFENIKDTIEQADFDGSEAANLMIKRAHEIDRKSVV